MMHTRKHKIHTHTRTPHASKNRCRRARAHTHTHRHAHARARKHTNIHKELRNSPADRETDRETHPQFGGVGLFVYFGQRVGLLKRHRGGTHDRGLRVVVAEFYIQYRCAACRYLCVCVGERERARERGGREGERSREKERGRREKEREGERRREKEREGEREKVCVCPPFLTWPSKERLTKIWRG